MNISLKSYYITTKGKADYLYYNIAYEVKALSYHDVREKADDVTTLA